jgi:hypothetical protein
MKKIFGLTIIFLTMSILGGCSSLSTDEVVRMSPDTYMLRVEDHAGIFAFNRGKMKSAAFEKANAFAESRGKIAVPIHLKEHPVGVLGDWPAVEYQFRVVSEDDPDAKRTSLAPRADFVMDKNIKIKGKLETHNSSDNKPDLYNQLIKLDDLRSKGILTEDEFKKQKELLLKN